MSRKIIGWYDAPVPRKRQPFIGRLYCNRCEFSYLESRQPGDLCRDSSAYAHLKPSQPFEVWLETWIEAHRTQLHNQWYDECFPYCRGTVHPKP